MVRPSACRGKLSVAEDVLALTQEHLQHVEALYRNGMMAKTKCFGCRSPSLEAELNRIRAENAAAVGWKALERAVGVQLTARSIRRTKSVRKCIQ